jgi:mono/diheme cytochrome c family protein/cytochrome c551/c552
MDHARSHSHDAEAAEKEKEWNEYRVREEAARAAAERHKVAKESKLADAKAALRPVSAHADRATRLYDLAGVTAAERKKASLFLQQFRDSPVLNSFAPVLKPEQDVFPELKEDYNFAMIPRVDRCVSCHMGIDKVKVDPITKAVLPVYTEENTPEKVFRTHPRPELFVASVSPHARTKVGCTVCHGGMGWGLSFNDAYHTPNSPAQEKEWKEKYHWHKGESWDTPMLRMKDVEAGCFKCHSDPVSADPLHKFAKEIPSAPKWNRGMRLVEESGCFGCHQIDGFTVRGLEKSLTEEKERLRKNPDLKAGAALEEALVGAVRKTGPELGRLRGKFPSEEAVHKWIWNPHDLRPTSNMPRFFGQPNNTGIDPQTGEDYTVRTRVEVAGIASLLWNRPLEEGETEWTPGAAPPPGDAERGKEIFGSTDTVGCVACHTTKDFPHPDGGKAADFGPELSTVGSKSTLAWLYRWAKEPHDYWAGTRMPSLRLTDQEAADVATYLSTMRDEAWEKRAPDAVPEAMVKQLALEAARINPEPGVDVEALVEKAPHLERLRMVGARAVAKYGCFGCHDGIPGTEKMERIGTELGGSQAWGSKDVDRLDFGLLEDPKAAERYARTWGTEHLAHRRHEWLRMKLLNPRVFDAGMTKKPHEKLVMPNFGFTEEEADAVATFILSQQKSDVPASRRKMLDADEFAAEKMRWVARQYNCYGCHTVDREKVAVVSDEEIPKVFHEWVARGRDVAPWLEGTEFWPPTLGGEGYEELTRIVERPVKDEDGNSIWVTGKDGKPEEKKEKIVEPRWVLGEQERRYYGEGFKVQSAWLFDFLRDPGAQVLRPWLKIRMPSFRFTPAELNALTRGFAAADGVPFPNDVSPHRDPLWREGMTEAKALFDAMQCNSCHIVDGKLPDNDMPAPDLGIAAKRLRYDWVVKWLAIPGKMQPKTRMPNNWGRDGVKAPGGLGRPYFKDDALEQQRRVAAYVMGIGDAPAGGGE